MSYVLTRARLATMAGEEGTCGLIDDGALVVDGGWIAWVGRRGDVPEPFRRRPERRLDGRLVTPALVDCHTHLVHGGASGGDLRAIVAATRAATAENLLAGALRRVDALVAEGVGTVEIKSGYGLDLETERRMLLVARHLPEHRAIRERTTFLGAHAVPDEYAGDTDGYLDLVVRDVLPALADDGLIDAVDAVLADTGFDEAQIARLFTAARALGLPVKLHADARRNARGGALAARFQALSADGLGHLDDDGVAAMAAAGTVAVLLPDLVRQRGGTRSPPVAALRDAGVAMAVATGCNPVSAPPCSLRRAMSAAVTAFELRPAEALAGTTRVAAAALGLGGEVGTLAAGTRADLAIWEVGSPADLVARLDADLLHHRVIGGRW